MNGPEHYVEAERLMDSAIGKRNGDELVLLAQVHATLALAAATVATRAVGPQEPWGGHAIDVCAEWREVTS